MNVSAKFDEIPSMILQDIKETNVTDIRTEGQRENSIPSNTVCGGDILIRMSKFDPFGGLKLCNPSERLHLLSFCQLRDAIIRHFSKGNQGGHFQSLMV